MDFVSENSLIGDVIGSWPETIGVLLSCGMHCLGCPASRSETLAEACAVHGLETEKVLFAVNARIAHERRQQGKETRI